MRKPALKTYALALSLSVAALTVPAYAAPAETPSTTTEAVASGATTADADDQAPSSAQTAPDREARSSVTIEAQQKQVHPGDQVTINVGGLDSGESVTVTVRDSDGKVVATLQSPRTERGTGETTVLWTVPANASLGSYSLTVDPQRATTSVTVVARPVPPMPEEPKNPEAPKPTPTKNPEAPEPTPTKKPENDKPEAKAPAPSTEKPGEPQGSATATPQAPGAAGATPSTSPSAKAKKGQSLAQTGVEGPLLALAASVLVLGGVALRLRSRA